MTFNPADYGIDLTNPVGALQAAQSAYVELVTSLKASKDEGKTRQLFTEWREANDPDALVEAVSPTFDYDDNDGARLLEIADALVLAAKSFRERADVRAKEQLGMKIGGDIREDKRETAEGLRSVVENLFGILYPMGMVPDTFPVKTGKNGDILPDLPKNAHRPRSAK